MLFDGKELSENTILSADICIVGCGVAGIVLANELKESVANIVVLESGGDNYEADSQALNEPDEIPTQYPNPSYSRLRFLGGTSNHWANNTSPLDPHDFEERSWVPNSGWPISFEDIAPYYAKAGDYCGTKNDGYSTDYWSKVLNKKDLLKNAKDLETGMAKASSPPVRFFATHGDKLNTAKNISVYKHCNLVDITWDEHSQQVSSVEFKTDVESSHKVNAKIFVMCLGGIENARMLLHFNNKYQNKLGNEYDHIGRYFMDHPLPRAAIFHANEKEKFSLYEGHDYPSRRVLGFLKLNEQALKKYQVNNLRMPLQAQSKYTLSDGISSYHIMADAFEDGHLPDDLSDHLLNFIRDFDLVAEAISRKKWQKKIFDHADEFGGFQIPLMMEQSPDRDNRVYLGQSKDKFGIPKVKIDWKISQVDKQRMWKTLEITAKNLGALSLGRMRLLREREDRMWGDQLGFGHHHMGTTRMANSAKTGVVDKNLKLFGTNNLYVAGSSVFVTGGHVPPTLTISALSIRLAKHLSKELNDAK